MKAIANEEVKLYTNKKKNNTKIKLLPNHTRHSTAILLIVKQKLSDNLQRMAQSF